MAPLAAVSAALFLLILLSGHEAAQAAQHHFAVKIRAGAGAGKDAASLCSGTDHPDLCMSAARKARGPTSEKSLIEASIHAAIRKILATKDKAASVVSRDGRTEGEIQTCAEVYDSALADLRSALKALRSESVEDLKELISSAMTNVDTCDEGYDEAGKTSPLAGPDIQANQLASNALALTRSWTNSGRLN